MAARRLNDQQFAGLLGVRSGLAAFAQLSEREARTVGATHAQHHVLLALRSHPDAGGPTVKDIAAALGVASPSAVELITRMVSGGLITRHADPADARLTRLVLTPLGTRLLHQLSEGHLPRLKDLNVRNAAFLAD